MSRRKKKDREFNLYRDPSTDPTLDWVVKGLVVLGEAVWAIISGIAVIAWNLVKSLSSTKDGKKK